MKEYFVPGEHRQILNIDRLNTNMQNTKFKEFASFKAWGCIQADAVEFLFNPHIINARMAERSKASYLIEYFLIAESSNQFQSVPF